MTTANNAATAVDTAVPDTAVLTPTCQNPTDDSQAGFSSAGLIGALESAWDAIRGHNPEVPPVVLVVASGTANGAAQAKWGHFAAMRWQHGTNKLPEVLVSGEGLKRPPAEVLTTLLHEAAHGLADVRQVKDTSRQGRWHNKKFADLATELGLEPAKDPKIGWSPCTLRPETAETYRPVLDELATALSLWRHPEPDRDSSRTNSNNGAACVCDCGRKIRASKTVLECGPILCGVCDAEFRPEDDDIDPNATSWEPVMHSLILDRVAARGMHIPFYDPNGERYGLPTYPYRFAPDGLLTVRQLRARELRPGGQDIAAQILWRNDKRVAYLYRVDLAKPKRTATLNQLAAIKKALLARRTCPTCSQVKEYYIPRRYGECFDCAPECQRWGAA